MYNWFSEFVKSKSAAAAGLCAWVINIIKFFEVFCDVEPKRKALAAANAELQAAMEKLRNIKLKVAVSCCAYFVIRINNWHSKNWLTYFIRLLMSLFPTVPRRTFSLADSWFRESDSWEVEVPARSRRNQPDHPACQQTRQWTSKRERALGRSCRKVINYLIFSY